MRVMGGLVIVILILIAGFGTTQLRVQPQAASSTCEQKLDQKQVTIDQMSLAIALLRQENNDLKAKIPKEGK